MTVHTGPTADPCVPVADTALQRGTERVRTDEHAGVGLGSAIVPGIVAAHGETLEPGGGLVGAVRLPGTAPGRVLPGVGCMNLRRTPRVLIAMVLLVPLVAVGTTAASAATRPGHHGRQLLFFNHVYAVLDRATADAIEKSAYLRRFANFQLRTTTGTDGQTWSGRYLLGRETYLELFAEGDLPGKDARLGSGGLGLSTTDEGDLIAVRADLVGPIDFHQTRDFGDGVPVPWFDAVYPAPGYDAFSPWAMEYRPEYFADPRSATEPAAYPGDVGRERYLPDDYRDHLMRDVTDVRIAISQRDLDATVPLLRAGRFAMHQSSSGTVLATHGGTTLRFAPTTGTPGLRRVELSLNHWVPLRRVEHLGGSTLTVGPGTRAVWTFPS